MHCLGRNSFTQLGGNLRNIFIMSCNSGTQGNSFLNSCYITEKKTIAIHHFIFVCLYVASYLLYYGRYILSGV